MLKEKLWPGRTFILHESIEVVLGAHLFLPAIRNDWEINRSCELLFAFQGYKRNMGTSYRLILPILSEASWCKAPRHLQSGEDLNPNAKLINKIWEILEFFWVRRCWFNEICTCRYHRKVVILSSRSSSQQKCSVWLNLFWHICLHEMAGY